MLCPSLPLLLLQLYRRCTRHAICVRLRCVTDGHVQVEEELTEIEQSWKTYEEFKREFDQISTQDWASFRDNMGDFEKFVKVWIDRVKLHPEDTVCSYLHQVGVLCSSFAHLSCPLSCDGELLKLFVSAIPILP